MAQPLSIENKDEVYLITTRTAGSRLWLMNNLYLESLILGILGKYQEVYGVVLYAFVVMGNHYHLIARFPNCNRAAFMRDFNSSVARLVGRVVGECGRRSIWARRYAHQVLPNPEDVRHWFYYVALNPVSSGLVSNISDYPSYNSFYDAANFKTRRVTWIDWSKYQIAKRHRDVKPEQFQKEYTLTFSKLPGDEQISNETYTSELINELRERQADLVKERLSQGKGFLGKDKIKSQSIGAKPKSTKTSERASFRPLVLTLCKETKKTYLQMYFAIQDAFLEASHSFRNGDRGAIFPTGTYPPPLPLTI